MADLGYYDDKLMQDQQQQGQNNGQGQPSVDTAQSGTSGVVTGGTGSTGVSTAGVGAGGTGGWTNIQAYLNANQGDNGSSQALQDKANSQYNTEYKALQDSASDTKKQAQDQANSINDAKKNSQQWVNQAANAYSWTGNQNSDYNNTKSKLQGALTGQYSGPSNYAYGTSDDFQKTQSALNDDQAFSNYMNGIYADKAGGQLSQGQGALQTQLDVNNQNLANTRANLLNQYSGFGDVINDTVTDTDKAIQDAQNQYGNNQAALKDYLSNYANDTYTNEQKAEADAKAAYNHEYNYGQSGYGTAGKNTIANFTPSNLANVNDLARSSLTKNLQNQGLWSDNFTWNDLNRHDKTWGNGSQWAGFPGVDVADFNNQIAERENALNNFYNQQTDKYKDTGDQQKREWNTLMDILGKSDRMNQGFNVRGA